MYSVALRTSVDSGWNTELLFEGPGAKQKAGRNWGRVQSGLTFVWLSSAGGPQSRCASQPGLGCKLPAREVRDMGQSGLPESGVIAQKE